MATDAANVSETALGPAALAMMAVRPTASDVPVLADKAYDCDWLREHLQTLGFLLLAPHRSNRVQASSNDRRRMRRYQRRWKVEQTFAWLHSYRRVVTRYEKDIHRFDGFAHLAYAFMALGNLI